MGHQSDYQIIKSINEINLNLLYPSIVPGTKYLRLLTNHLIMNEDHELTECYEIWEELYSWYQIVTRYMLHKILTAPWKYEIKRLRTFSVCDKGVIGGTETKIDFKYNKFVNKLNSRLIRELQP